MFRFAGVGSPTPVFICPFSHLHLGQNELKSLREPCFSTGLAAKQILMLADRCCVFGTKRVPRSCVTFVPSGLSLSLLTQRNVRTSTSQAFAGGGKPGLDKSDLQPSLRHLGDFHLRRGDRFSFLEGQGDIAGVAPALLDENFPIAALAYDREFLAPLHKENGVFRG